jgi:hypothetical protein
VSASGNARLPLPSSPSLRELALCANSSGLRGSCVAGLLKTLCAIIEPVSR